MQKQSPRIAVFSLGGTIASTATPGAGGGGVTPQLGADDLVGAVPQLSEVAQVEPVAFRQLPSAELTFTDLVELAAEISKQFESGVSGAVVTQGTDTIEESAFALDLLMPGPQPVVVTGAMRNPTLAGADGPANLLAAVQVAASPPAAGLGCLVVLADEIHAARFVRKTHTSNPAAFRSAVTGPIGWVVEGRPHIAVRVDPLAQLLPAPGRPVPRVALIKVCLGDDGRLLDQLESLGFAGLVVEGFGGGHVPGALAPVLERLAGRMPVVLASRTGTGQTLRETYGFPGSERDLLGRKLISAGFLDGLKARVLLSLLLASGADINGVRARFDRVGGFVG
jgi:L-asparaginase